MSGTQYTLAAFAIALGLIACYAVVLFVEIRAARGRKGRRGDKP